MKNIKLVSNIAAEKSKRPHLTPLATFVVLATLTTATAATALGDPASAPDPNPLQPLIDGLAGKYGWLTTVVLLIGSLRILFKPIMLAIDNYVRQTPSPADDARVARFETGWLYKLIAFLLDFTASIKLPNTQPPPQNP